MDTKIRIHHKALAESGRWLEFSSMEQLSNVGTDIERAIRWKQKGNLDDSAMAFERALELLDLTIADPKNRKRLREILRARELMVDYFVYDNIYKTDDAFWQKYFLFFSYIAADERAKRYAALVQKRATS